MRSTTFSVAGIAILAAIAIADVPFSTDAGVYNSGSLGHAPNQTFRSSNIVAPIFQVNTFDTNSIDSAPYLVFEWKINGRGSPMIFRTDDLSLVYADQQYPSANNVQIQSIKGKDYLTFWEGTEELFHGNGYSLVFDDKYQLKYNVTPVGLTSGRLSDEHEFQFTAEGNALITVFEPITWDFSALGGPSNGVLLDQLFQEINPKTGELVFSWRASDHFPITDSYDHYPEDVLADGTFDPFHMNSVAKYGGNYLVNSRNFHSVIMVDGTNGSTIWVLGGKNNMFHDLSDGRATNFALQHYSRLHDSHLTLFDNHFDQNNIVGCTANCSRGLHLNLDFTAMTAEVVAEYFHPRSLQSVGRGGLNILKNGNALIAWGTNPAITEHAGDRVVMDIQVGPLVSGFIPGVNAPYRAFRTEWTAKPTWKPSIAADSSTVYLSWNGATELASWVVLASDNPNTVNGRNKVVAKSKRNGFETIIPLTGTNAGRYVRAAALDSGRRILGSTAVVDRETGQLISVDYDITSYE